jgi:hypothetical protein
MAQVQSGTAIDPIIVLTASARRRGFDGTPTASRYR